MNYNEALDYIHGTLKFGSKLGLHNITILLELMGNPHHKLKFVHVAGTNGKGSTVSFISSILIEAGYKVGIYTSPYLQRFTERIKVNWMEISQEDLARVTEFVKSKVEEMVSKGENHPTEFEIVTAIAFQYYYECACDVVVLEVGLGGRFDATNVIDTPLVSVITTINYDHMEWLGNTLPEIAFEKAGIIKPGGDTVIYPQSREVEKVFVDICESRDSKLHRVGFDDLEILEFGVDGQKFNYSNYKELEISLLGEHQTQNAALSVKVIELLNTKGFIISEEDMRRGLKNAQWPGRFEILGRSPVLLIDGAHNEEGAKVLGINLRRYFPDKKIIFIFGVLKDKNYKAIIEEVIPLASSIITVTPNSNRAMHAEELAKILRPYCKDVLVSDTIEEAVQKSLSKASKEDVICAFGSLYYIGEIRSIIDH